MLDAVLERWSGWLVSNLLVSAALALTAFAVQRRWGSLRVGHALWVLALVKLVTPPLWVLPLVPIPGEVEPAPSVIPMVDVALPAPPLAALGLEDEVAAATPWSWQAGLLGVWALGSAAVLVLGAWRVGRFHLWFHRSATVAPGAVQRLAGELAGRLGLRRTPEVIVVEARVSPMVWWRRGRAIVCLPEGLLREAPAAELRWMLAHELAHVARRDHWVRWLEALVGMAFWWNPIVWWARRNLRQQEEIHCDGLVLETFRPAARTYANALLMAVEFLAGSAHRPPAVASAMTGGGVLERRFQMIMSHSPQGRRASRWTRAAALALGIAVLPAGIAYAQAPDFEAVGNRLVRAVRGGEVSPEQAEEMMAELARVRFLEMLGERGERPGVARGASDRDAIVARRVEESEAVRIDANAEGLERRERELEARQKAIQEALTKAYVNHGAEEAGRQQEKLEAALDAQRAALEDARARFEAERQQALGLRKRAQDDAARAADAAKRALASAEKARIEGELEAVRAKEQMAKAKLAAEEARQRGEHELARQKLEWLRQREVEMRVVLETQKEAMERAQVERERAMEAFERARATEEQARREALERARSERGRESARAEEAREARRDAERVDRQRAMKARERARAGAEEAKRRAEEARESARRSERDARATRSRSGSAEEQRQSDEARAARRADRAATTQDRELERLTRKIREAKERAAKAEAAERAPVETEATKVDVDVRAAAEKVKAALKAGDLEPAQAEAKLRDLKNLVEQVQRRREAEAKDASAGAGTKPAKTPAKKPEKPARKPEKKVS